jgi:hypothetical protein
MENWKNGKLEECDISTIRQWKIGIVEEWVFNWQLTTYALPLMPYAL